MAAATVLRMRGTVKPPSPQVAAQVNLVNSVTRNLIFSKVSQSYEKASKTGDDEIVVLTRATNFMVHCEGNSEQICVRLDDEATNTTHITFPVSSRSRLQWTGADEVSSEAHVMFHSNDGHILAFVDPSHSVRWFVGEWVPRAQEAAFKLVDPGFRNAANPPDALRERSKKQTWTPWYTSPHPTPNNSRPTTPLYSPDHDSAHARFAPEPEPVAYVPGDGVAPTHTVPDVERQRRMDENVQEIIREIVSLLYTPGTELQALQRLQMIVSVEPMLLCRQDTLTILRQILEKTADAGTARQAIVFADEYLHITEVVRSANALGLYQLVEAGFKPARAAPDAVTRNKATAIVGYVMQQRPDLRQRPKPPPARVDAVDTTSFLGKLGSTQQPLGTTAVEEAAAKRQLPVKSAAAEAWLERMRVQLDKRGSNTQKMLAIRFKIMDDDGKKTISKQEFQSGMLEMQCPIDEVTTDELFNYYTFGGGPKEGKEMNFEQFLVLMRGYLSPARRAMVHRAFTKMDRNGSGVIDWMDLAGVYSVAQHPKVLSGEYSEEQALTAHLAKYGDEGFLSDGDGRVSLAEFEQYYANISASIDTDEYFTLMMQQAWQI
eukprot:SAG11_NODE_2147_length_3753_cov_2.218391_2_plen_603_part_00